MKHLSKQFIVCPRESKQILPLKYLCSLEISPEFNYPLYCLYFHVHNKIIMKIKQHCSCSLNWLLIDSKRNILLVVVHNIFLLFLWDTWGGILLIQGKKRGFLPHTYSYLYFSESIYIICLNTGLDPKLFPKDFLCSYRDFGGTASIWQNRLCAPKEIISTARHVWPDIRNLKFETEADFHSWLFKLLL